MTTSASTDLKKTNIYDANALKIVLDDYAKNFLIERGFQEDHAISNLKIIVGGFGKLFSISFL